MNIKYRHNGYTIRKVCYEMGLSESKYKNILWRMKNKCMSFDEALSFKRQPARKDQVQRKIENGRRFRGYSDDEIKMSKKDAERFGIMKRAKYTVGDKTLFDYCKKNNISYQTIYARITKQNMAVREALNEPIIHKRKIYYKGQPINEVFDGKKCHRIYGRVSEGWPVDLACELPIDSFYNRKAPEECVKSKVWASLGYRKSGVHIINNNKGVVL